MDTAGLAKAGFMAMLLIAVFGVIAFFFRRCANRFALRCSRAAGLRRARAAEAAAEGGPHGGGWLRPRLGLGYAAIAALPLTELARAAECAVCLGELAAGEAARLLPLCGHAFHVVCVDTWLRFRATCPLCRQAVIHVNVHVDAQPTAPVPAPAEEPILLPPALPQNDDSRAPLAQARDGGGEGSHSLLLVVD